MCGIAGIVASDRLDRRTSARAAVACATSSRTAGRTKRACSSTSTRRLAHRRLSIVDLAPGHQPLSNEDGSIWIVFNGEIYNHADDPRRARSARPPSTARARDTETIVHAYEQWGDACVERFRGMFAFAIWDAPRRRLLLARDRLGDQAALLGRASATGCCSDPRSRRCSRAAWSTPKPNDRAIPELLEHALPVGRRDAVPRHPQAAARPHAGVRARRGRRSGSTGTSRPDAAIPRSSGCRRRDAVARFRELLEEAVRLAADGRRAARHVPVRRHRQQRDRRADGAA